MTNERGGEKCEERWWGHAGLVGEGEEEESIKKKQTKKTARSAEKKRGATGSGIQTCAHAGKSVTVRPLEDPHSIFFFFLPFLRPQNLCAHFFLNPHLRQNSTGSRQAS
jgi:hypothetical protein